MGGSRQRTLWCSRMYLNCEADNISSYGMRDKEKGKPENLSSHQCARVQGRCICELLARRRQGENSDSTPKANPLPCQCFPQTLFFEWENTDPVFSFPVWRRNFNYKANCRWSAPGSVCGGLEPMKKRLLFFHSFTRTPSF